MITLSPDQSGALDHVLSLLHGGARVVTLAGAAGTGKTTIMREVLDRSGFPFVLAAPTGKAALRLEELTGQPAMTLHRVAYAGARELDDGSLVFHRREAGSVTPWGAIDFDRTNRHEYNDQAAKLLRGLDRALLIIDEASMVGTRIMMDLIGGVDVDGRQVQAVLGEGIQILAVGDHCQLPPVKAEPAFDLEGADARLDRVHRQAEGSPLLALATELRTRRAVLDRHHLARYGFRARRSSATELGHRIAVQLDMVGSDFVVLVSTNRQRLAVNRAARAALLLPPMSEGPACGERVILLDNNYGIPCANGEIGTVLEARPWTVQDWLGEAACGWTMTVDLGDRVAQVSTTADAWTRTQPAGKGGRVLKSERDRLKRIDYSGGLHGVEAGRVRGQLVGCAPAYAITVHKSQGSEWDCGVFVMGRCDWLGADAWRLPYTGITRFRSDCDFVYGVNG